MADYAIPKSGVAYIFYIGLVSQADTKLLQVNPTIAAGDFKVSIDGGALTDLTTLPAVTPAGGRLVKISLSASEMTGDNITVQCVDAAGAEWCAQIVNIQTCPVALGSLLTTALTEAYAADGAAATPAQLLHMIWAFLAERSVSGTTVTVKKLDGSTSAMTFTLDSATVPASQTRAT